MDSKDSRGEGDAGVEAPNVVLSVIRKFAFDANISVGFVPLTPEKLLQNVPWRARSSGPLTCLRPGLIGLLARV
jgi:hypothetical protein